MDRNKTWVKIYRQIQDTTIWASDQPFDYRSAWIDLIMMANIEDKTILYQGHVIQIKRGDVYTSIRKLADRWHWSNGKVSRFINILIQLEMIKKRKSVKCATLLSLVNYESFQSKRNTDGHSDRHTDKHTDGYSDEDTGGRLLKNTKNEKEIKEEQPPTSEEVVAAEEDEKPPVPGAVRMANGGWNYTPDIDWESDEWDDEEAT